MSPLNRGPLLGPRMPPNGMRPPPPRFGRLPLPGMPPRMPPPPPPPPHSMGSMFGPMRPRMPPPRPGGIMRPGGPPPLFGARNRGPLPLMLPMMGPRGMGPHGPLMRAGPRGILPPQILPHMRPRFRANNANVKTKLMNSLKKVSKIEELKLKKPWMTDEIRSEIQKKNKLYAKAKKNKDAKEQEEFKNLRNKVTRMIRDARNEYFAKNPDAASLYQDDPEYFDEKDENDEISEEEEEVYYCEMCDRDFVTEKLLHDHNETHQVCNIDGCTFIAHPKLVEKHIRMQHHSGLYSKIKNLSTPEEISKWIEERKRKYPTKVCIENKKAEILEKQERGEIITKYTPKKVFNQTKKIPRIKNRRIRKSRGRQEKNIEIETAVQLYRGIRPFTGTMNLDVDNDCDQIADSEFVTNDVMYNENPSSSSDTVQTFTVSPPKTSKLITSLVADYSSDTDNEKPDEIPIEKEMFDVNSLNSIVEEKPCETTNILEHSKDLQITENNLITTSKNETTKNIPKEKKDPQLSIKSNELGKRNRRQQQRHMLLQRLLSRSIEHERNFICQCIKYIQDNNFFSSSIEVIS